MAASQLSTLCARGGAIWGDVIEVANYYIRARSQAGINFRSRTASKLIGEYNILFIIQRNITNGYNNGTTGSGGSLKDAMDILGHANLSTTQRYLETNPNAQ